MPSPATYGFWEQVEFSSSLGHTSLHIRHAIPFAHILGMPHWTSHGMTVRAGTLWASPREHTDRLRMLVDQSLLLGALRVIYAVTWQMFAFPGNTHRPRTPYI